MAGAESTLQQALALGEEGRWHEMAELLAAALEVEPDDPYFLCWLGVAERELGNDGAAYEYFRRVIDRQPTDPNLLAVAGSGLAAFDDPEAEPALRAAALTGPDVPAARLQYGSYLARAGVFEEALEHLRAAVDLAPDDAAVHSELGTALALKGDLAGAVAAMETALELAPDDAWTRLILGLLYAELQSLEEAAEALIQAAEEREDDTEAHLLAALAATAVGWEEAAHTALTRADYAAEGDERTIIEEVEDRVLAGPETARRWLLDTFAPPILRERLSHPL